MATYKINDTKKSNQQNTLFNVNNQGRDYRNQYESSRQTTTRMNYNKPLRPATAYHPHYLVSILLMNTFIRNNLYHPYISSGSNLNNKPFVSIYSFYRIIKEEEEE